MRCNPSGAAATTTLLNFAPSKRSPSHPLVLTLRSTTGSYSTPVIITNMSRLLCSLKTGPCTKCRGISSKCCGNKEKTAHWSLLARKGERNEKYVFHFRAEESARCKVSYKKAKHILYRFYP